MYVCIKWLVLAYKKALDCQSRRHYYTILADLAEFGFNPLLIRTVFCHDCTLVLKIES